MAAQRVLIVDDEPPILEFAARALCAAGYKVLRAATAARALELVKGGDAVDLVVSDIVMPEMQGPQLVTEIQRVSPCTGAVLMSGYVGAAEVPANVPFLVKPFSPRDLVGIVERALASLAALRDDVKQVRARAQELSLEGQRLCAEARTVARHSRQLVEQAQRRLARPRKPAK
jgi:DNA-binding NtrC family response regulator